MSSGFDIREARPEDIDKIVDFTCQEARETEGTEKNVAGVRRGVRAGFGDLPLARYWVAESPPGHIVASTSVVTEWSNFHGGFYWWIQSLYVQPDRRGEGLADALLARLEQEARAAGALDLRLCVLDTNRRALKVYRRCGFGESPYTIMTKKLDTSR
jgi:GNAT superfamily N-acetyltransferase